MVLDISKILHTPGFSVSFDFHESWRDLDVSGEMMHFTEPIHASGICQYTGDDVYLLVGGIDCYYQTLCSRCAQEMQTSMHVDIHEEYAKQEDEENPDRYLFEGNRLELDKMVEDLILLQVPMRHLCQQECKGLCPVCGNDRNLKPCGCTQEEPVETKQPFAMLKSLLSDDEEV